MDRISKAQIKLVRSLQQKKFRDTSGLFVAEGQKCIEELSNGFEPEFIVVPSGEAGLSAQRSFRQSRSLSSAVFLSASTTEIEQMSSLRTPQGSIAIFKKKGTNTQSPTNPSLTLALDGIQDPGNLGTIIRTCDWFGVHTIICSQDTADCYNPKVVQATMGALARVDVRYTNLPDYLHSASEQGCSIIGTTLDGINLYDFQTPGSDNEIIVMGNEGNGISEAVRAELTTSVRIPTYPANKKASDVVESLNVSIATAIILAQLRRGS